MHIFYKLCQLLSSLVQRKIRVLHYLQVYAQVVYYLHYCRTRVHFRRIANWPKNHIHNQVSRAHKVSNLVQRPRHTIVYRAVLLFYPVADRPLLSKPVCDYEGHQEKKAEYRPTKSFSCPHANEKPDCCNDDSVCGSNFPAFECHGSLHLVDATAKMTNSKVDQFVNTATRGVDHSKFWCTNAKKFA